MENETYHDQIVLLELVQKGQKEFWLEFQKVYPAFKDNIHKINPKITKSELNLAAYISLDFTTNEIAELTFRAFKTVETTRYNLRKKLQLDPEVNLNEYLKSLL